MLAVQAAGGRIRMIVLVAQTLAATAILGIAVASVVIVLSVPCPHRQRIGTSGFSLGDQCLQR